MAEHGSLTISHRGQSQAKISSIGQAHLRHPPPRYHRPVFVPVVPSERRAVATGWLYCCVELHILHTE